MVHDCDGTIIICADKNNNIYKAVDTSVKKIIAFDGKNNTFIVPPKIVETSVCKDTQTLATVLITECYNLVITSQELSGADSACFSVIPKTLPVHLHESGTSFGVKLIVHDSVRDYSTDLHLKGYYQYGKDSTVAFDTIIKFTIGVTPVKQMLLADKETVAFKTTRSCSDQGRQTAALTNHGCSPIIVTGGPFGVTQPFSVDPITLPRTLAPGDTIQFHVNFDPDSVKTYVGSVLFTSESPVDTQSLYVPLLGVHMYASPKLEARDSLVDMRNVALCLGKKDTTVVVVNKGCDPLRITDINEGKSPYFSIDSAILPITLSKDQEYSIAIDYHPTVPGFHADTITFTSESNGIQRSNSIALRGTGKASVPKLVSSAMSLDLGTVSLCGGPRDTIISIRNDGCDTLTLISGPGQVQAPFSITLYQLPMIISPRSSVNIKVRLDAIAVGSFSDMLEYETERYGLRSILIIELVGSCTYGEGLLSVGPESIGFSPLTICSKPDLQHGFISNNGCDSITVSGVSISNQKQLSLLVRETPFTIAPGDSEQYVVTLTPSIKGKVQSELMVSAHDVHGTQKKMTAHIPITAEITNGTRLLISETEHIYFGSRRVCDKPDTLITYINRGCDTVTISSATLTGKSFELDEYPTPIRLAPNEKIQLRILSLIDTINNNLVSSGALALVSNSEIAATDVLIDRKYLYPSHIQTTLALSRAQATSGDTIALKLTLEGTLVNMKEFDGELFYTPDLLTFIGYDGKNKVTHTEGRLHIENDASLEATTTLYFRATLTTVSSTNIELTSCWLNASDPSYGDCIATITGSTVRFDYESICGDNTLAGYLQNGNIASIRSISPNPLHGKTCDVKVYSPETMMMQIDIVDMNGVTAATYRSMPTLFTKGEHTIKLNVNNLLTGTYYVRLTDGNGFVQVKKIVEVK